MSARNRTFPMYTIYDHPSDYPDCFVARRFEIGPSTVAATDIILTADTLDAVRQKVIAKGYTARLPRAKEDDPVVVESYI